MPRRLTDVEALRIREEHARGVSVKILARFNFISPESVRRIVRGETHTRLAVLEETADSMIEKLGERIAAMQTLPAEAASELGTKVTYVTSKVAQQGIEMLGKLPPGYVVRDEEPTDAPSLDPAIPSPYPDEEPQQGDQ